MKRINLYLAMALTATLLTAAYAASRIAQDNFMRDAAHAGMAEVMLGNLALEKSESDEVKRFAQQMVTDHTAANEELKTLAASKNMTLPTEAKSSHQSALEKLRNRSGADFDRAFMKQMVSDHEKVVSMFRKASESHSDAEVKAWAAKTLPTLESHLAMARSMSNGGNNSNSNMGDMNMRTPNVRNSNDNRDDDNRNSNRSNKNTNDNSNRSNSNNNDNR